jgi:hypothetical protein
MCGIGTETVLIQVGLMPPSTVKDKLGLAFEKEI